MVKLMHLRDEMRPVQAERLRGVCGGFGQVAADAGE